MSKCLECGESRVIQFDATDRGYDFVVFGCYSQFHIDCMDKKMVMVLQGTLCKNRVIHQLKEKVKVLEERSYVKEAIPEMQHLS